MLAVNGLSHPHSAQSLLRRFGSANSNLGDPLRAVNLSAMATDLAGPGASRRRHYLDPIDHPRGVYSLEPRLGPSVALRIHKELG